MGRRRGRLGQNPPPPSATPSAGSTLYLSIYLSIYIYIRIVKPPFYRSVGARGGSSRARGVVGWRRVIRRRPRLLLQRRPAASAKRAREAAMRLVTRGVGKGKGGGTGVFFVNVFWCRCVFWCIFVYTRNNIDINL